MPKVSTKTHNPTRVLLLSGYDAQSHNAWRQTLECGLDEIHWTQLALPPRYFNWRVRGNSLSWAFNKESRAILEGDYDLLIATSMVDLSALRGFVPKLSQLPAVVYFHENQFCYPENAGKHNSVEPQLLSIYSALCAQQLWFNSEFNRQSYLSGARSLLKKLPDAVPSGLIEQLTQISRSLPVPLGTELSFCSVSSSKKHSFDSESDKAIQLVWNHRWEYDKAPERLLACVKELINRDVKFTLHVLGQRFRQLPDAFDELKSCLFENHCMGQWGYVESRQAYLQILEESDLVLSTALHDFQGLSVLEAVRLGCIPVLPSRQVYPEWFDEQYLYPSSSEIVPEACAMAEKIIQFSRCGPPAPELKDFDQQALLSRYREAIQALVN